MQFLRALVVLAGVIVAASTTALAQAPAHQPGSLTVVQPWARATAPTQKAGGVYLRIDNAGSQPDRLIGVATDWAEKAALHAMVRDGDVMKMRPVAGGIEVPANGHVVLAPGGKHIMLIGLRQRLVEQSKVPLSLIFERAGRLDIEAVIQAAGARGPAAHGAHGMPAKSGH